jgi:hypothetical protein
VTGAPALALPREVLASLDADKLGSVVATSRSWRQVSKALGLSASRHGRRLRALCDAWGISYAHFRHHVFTDDQLREVLSTATTWTEAMSRLGYTEESGSARATIRKHAARLRLDVTTLAARPRPGTASVSLEPELRHLRRAGAYLVSAACALAGHHVSWPLEPAAYDLVVDTGDRRLRVQVKTCSRQIAGSWNCAITRSEYADVAGGKRRAWYTAEEIDAFAVVDGDGEIYFIPVDDVIGLTSL